MSRPRDDPPSNWLLGVTVIDADLDIYLAPSIMTEAADAVPAFIHWCGRPHEHWQLAGTPAHTVVSREPWHLEPSVLCSVCGLHGWIRDGRWQSA